MHDADTATVTMLNHVLPLTSPLVLHWHQEQQQHRYVLVKGARQSCQGWSSVQHHVSSTAAWSSCALVLALSACGTSTPFSNFRVFSSCGTTSALLLVLLFLGLFSAFWGTSAGCRKKLKTTKSALLVPLQKDY